MRGLVVRSQSGFYTVETESGSFLCRLRGRMKRGPRLGDVVALGDWVELTPLDGGNGVIETLEPRLRMLSRTAPQPQGAYQQIIIANPDQACFVFACASPEPRLGMLDRFLVIAEKQGIPAIIVANKTDLVGQDQARALFGHYPPLGYPVIYTSAKSGECITELRAAPEWKAVSVERAFRGRKIQPVERSPTRAGPDGSRSQPGHQQRTPHDGGS